MDFVPSARDLNRLLSCCNEPTYSPKKLADALENSFCNLCILNEKNNNLVGFVRATSDHGLNANLWNLVAEPGEFQAQLIAVLVHRVLHLLRRDMPGCSISIAASSIAIQSLKANGFVIDPAGIRAMAFKLR